MRIPRIFGLTPAPKTEAPILAPSAAFKPTKPAPALVKHEIFVGLAGAGAPGATIRNDGEFSEDMNVSPIGVLTYFDIPKSDGLFESSRAYFTYSEKYSGPALDPVNMNYETAGTRMFEVPPALADSGLFRVFSDCVPGQHGRRNLNRERPETKKMNDLQLLDWLASGSGKQANGFSGGFTSGALVFFTKHPGDERPMLELQALEEFRIKTVQDLAGLAVRMTDQEIAASIVHGGVRPKTTYFDATGEVGKPGTHYIVKFNNAAMDANNNARVEHGSLTLAQLAGIHAAKTVVVRVLSDGKAVADMFLTERFDRFMDDDGRDTRQHRLSLLSLMDPKKVRSQDAGDYHDIFDAIRKISSEPEADCEEMFRRMLFNIAINNTDDHLKNHEMVCEQPGNKWRLSPAFDITPNKSPYPHATSMAGHTNGTLKDDFVLKVAMRLDIDRHVAVKIRDEVASAVSKWVPVFEAAGCSSKDIAYVQEAINQHGKRAEALLGFGKNLPDPLARAQSMTKPGELEAIRAAPRLNIEVTAPKLAPYIRPRPGAS